MNNWYVYRHIRLDKNEPFYVGIGNKKDYLRAYEKHPSKRNIIWNKIVSKTDYEVEIIYDEITKTEASEKEKEFIRLYGRKDLKSGILCNLTDGGDGVFNCIRSDETKEKLRINKMGSKNPMFGKKQSIETLVKRRIFESRNRSEETKIKQSLASVKSGQAKKTAVYIYETKELVGIYHSASEAIRSVGLDPIRHSCKVTIIANKLTNRKRIGKYTFEYVQ
jgi:hypothetical protein